MGDDSVADEASDALTSMTERLARLQDEFFAYRDRTQRQAEHASRQGAEQLCRALLPSLDSFELVLVSLPDGSLAQGVSLAHVQLCRALADSGLVPIDTTGVPFDPSLHEAVATDPSAQADLVAAVVRTGYRFGDTVLRAASVTVGTAPTSKTR